MCAMSSFTTMLTSSSSSEEDVIVLAALCHEHEEKKAHKRKYWVHDIFRARLQEGEFHTLFNRLQEDERKFYMYYRMTPEKFNQLVDIVRVHISKQDSKFRMSIGPYERLTVLIR